MASRKEQKEALRQERAAREASARRDARKRIVGLAAAAILVLAIVGAIVAVLVVDGGGGQKPVAGGASVDFPDGGSVPDQTEADLATAAKAAGCVSRDFKSEGEEHTGDDVTYKSNPPHSGDHDPVPADDDVYEREIRDENLVHALEHGRVIFWVRPDAGSETLGTIKALYDEDPYHVILTPKPDLPAPIAASAWTHTLTCEKPGVRIWDALRAFKDTYRDKGPEFVP